MWGKQKPDPEVLGKIFGRLEALEARPVLGKDVAETLVEHKEQLEALADSYATLVEENKQLTLAVAEGIERVERAHRRIQATVTRARKELRKSGFADPALEAEAEDLALVSLNGDDAGSSAHGLQPVREEVAAPSETASSIPGVSAETLNRVRGV